MKTLIVEILFLLGASFMLLAAIGLLRMPDFFTRMHAATKAPSLGASLLLVAAAIHFSEIGITTRAFAIIFFIFLTTPVAAHLIGRTAYLLRIPMSAHTVLDQWKEHRDQKEANQNATAPKE
ncbi:MAG: Na+/H+ antiporter subunit G [Verrucomicrobia bacterium CG_4_10_14_3_um_filter_43_23]|nr:MAG: Na+/H+ antiporter subunit G [Verrucomicrobia bacterium CG22_combo_CG10-13_8_21_14_all_43_17]PIX58186.1 MAG: Na+/H+ antiporter subunit G [Verrucomicrobia bacterium CG_4_10_14_3_um_filter_43_23]PIY60839.1 MAG: Na+/H+ antiporter subunit G [Verrucomicrobia bacterium CG_4_10_14_0_8_um_filter_43_34]PJA44329.1 MAG: Na+/H+ antiporter subunit G [Verrucomicrobia bacterium CG_4_9_14_3_um_filter_43_20]